MSWWQLLDVQKAQEDEFEFWATNPPLSCPNDGEPLLQAPPSDSGSDTQLYCPWGDYEYPRDWIRPERL